MDVKEVKEIQVVFNFGSIVTVGVKIYTDKTLKECILLKSDDIVGYIFDGKYISLVE